MREPDAVAASGSFFVSSACLGMGADAGDVGFRLITVIERGEKREKRREGGGQRVRFWSLSVYSTVRRWMFWWGSR